MKFKKSVFYTMDGNFPKKIQSMNIFSHNYWNIVKKGNEYTFYELSLSVEHFIWQCIFYYIIVEKRIEDEIIKNKQHKLKYFSLAYSYFSFLLNESKANY